MKNLDIAFIQHATINNIDKGEIQLSNIHGYGLFARENIGVNEILCVLDGQVIPWHKYQEIEANVSKYVQPPYEKYLFMEWNALDEETLLVRSLRTKYSYINHSRKANIEVTRHPLRLTAICPVPKGEELTIDYRQEPLNSVYLDRPDKYYL